ncbi:MAG: STAS domain-containing protein [Phycisphaerales bacterium]|nr:STAS domain-containing protein [Phycisphaerales bacterium]
MKFSYEDHDAITVLTVSGDFSADQADNFRRKCQERFRSGIRDIVLDVEHLALIDSAGLELLLWLQDEAALNLGQLRIVQPNETIRKILEITRLDKRFDMHNSIESAAKSLR